VTNVTTLAVGDDAAGERDFNAGIFFEKFLHGRERAGQILFVAIQIREDVAGRAAVAAVHRVIHAGVFFDERLYARVVRQPVLRAVIGAGILHDVLQRDALLIGHGRDAQLEPRGIAEARRDDRKFQGCHFKPLLPALAIKVIPPK